MTGSQITDLRFEPLTMEQWHDFETLFGPRGACGGCWCMYWRLTHTRFNAQKGPGNRDAMKQLVISGCVPGLLAYAGDKPVGWCALAPRSEYSYLARSTILKPIDNTPCWSISCLFIHREYRRQGLSIGLIKAACELARSAGADLIEAYPVEPKAAKPLAPAFAWTGLPSAYSQAGFNEITRRSPTRPIMRRAL